jgi:IrrE N-terminal-like domain
MDDDYRVKGRSDAECRDLAKKLRAYFGVSEDSRVDILACFASRSIWTTRGIQRLNFQIRPDSEMGHADAVTSYGKGVVTIAAKQSVQDKAFVGEGRARNTLAHEFGHAVMHEGVPMARHGSAVRNVTPKWLPAFQSAEHQAKVFAAAFLINDKIANTLFSAEEISVEFGISLESANIYFSQITDLRNREKSTANVLRMADEFRALTTSAQPKIRYINELCTSCGNPTVFPIGIKFMCDTCHTVIDRFQDGDSVA